MANVDGLADSGVGRLIDGSPAPVRDLVATTYALGIQRQRFGPEFRRFYRLLAGSEHASAERARRAQAARLGWYLRHAIVATRYYAELAEELDIGEAVRELTAGAVPGSGRGAGNADAALSASAWHDAVAALRLFPPLERETVRARRLDLQCGGARGGRPRVGRPVTTHTSGTTGTALELAIGRAGLQRSYACVWHHYSWFGLGLNARVAAFVSQTITAGDRERPPYWVTDLLRRERLFSSYHVSPGSAPAYARALCEFRPEILRGLPSSIGALAHFALEQGLELPRPALVVTTSEALGAGQRAVIAEAFGAPVVEFYGTTERAVHAFECPEGSLHVLPQAGVVEVVKDDGTPAAPGEEGELLCTGLLDDVMPLLRYRIGDRAVLGRDFGGVGPAGGHGSGDERCAGREATAPRGEGTCRCGRPGTVLRELTGRVDDVIVTPEGRRIGRLDQPFKHTPAIREAQVVQDRRDRLLVRVVPRSGFGDEAQEAARRLLEAKVGRSMELRFELVEEIPRGPGGKFQVTRVAPAARVRLQRGSRAQGSDGRRR